VNVIDGIKIIQKYFPGVIRRAYLEPEVNESMAKKLHAIGTQPPEDRSALVREMDYHGLGIIVFE